MSELAKGYFYLQFLAGQKKKTLQMKKCKYKVQ